MKKTLLLIFLLFVGISLLSLMKAEKKSEVSFTTVPKNNPVVEQGIHHPVIANVPVESASLENIEEQYNDMEIKELQTALERVDKSREKLQLIEAFNSRKLSDQEATELATIIRTRVVLTKLVMEKKIEELESL